VNSQLGSRCSKQSSQAHASTFYDHSSLKPSRASAETQKWSHDNPASDVACVLSASSRLIFFTLMVGLSERAIEMLKLWFENIQEGIYF
jgi:hypothetical protein